MRTAKLFLMAACAVLMLSAFAAADTPGAHPAYLHALTDLRHARAHLDVATPNGRVDSNETQAIEYIDSAIRDIKEAAIDDGKNLNDHPPVDEHWNRTNRLKRAMELLNGAYHDINEREQDGWARGLKHRALQDIDGARNAVHHAMDAARHE